MDEARASTEDVLKVVSVALRGDRKGVVKLVAKVQNRVEKRVKRELRGLVAHKPAPTLKRPKIHGARLSAPKDFPPTAPPGALTMRLPNGRRVRVVVAPAAARHRDLSALRRISGVNTRRVYDAVAHNARAIDQLAAAQRELAERVTRLQSNGDLALLRGLVDGLGKLERRLGGVKRLQDRALKEQKRSLQGQIARQTRASRLQNRAAQIQKLQGAVASAQSAAFGTAGDLLATNNLLLAANQVGWSFAPEILKAFGIAKAGTSSPFAWLAPLASLVTSQAILGRRQHERFVSGVITIHPADDNYYGYVHYDMARLSLRGHIAPAEWDLFAKRTDVPVTTMVLDPKPPATSAIWSGGEVQDGTLTVRIGIYDSMRYHASPSTGLPEQVIVAWTVDTRRPNGREPSQ